MILAIFIFAIVFILLVIFVAEPLAEYLAMHDRRPERKSKRYIVKAYTPEGLYQILHFIQFGWNEWTESLNRKWRRV